MVTLARRWHRVECDLALAAYSIIGVLLIADVLGRELLAPLLRVLGLDVGATSWSGSQRVAIYALVLGSFCGLGIATATNSHLIPRVLFRIVPERFSAAMSRLADLITGAFMIVVVWYAIQFVLSTKASSMRVPVLGWEVWPFQLAIPLGFASAAGRHLLFAAFPGVKPPPPEFQE